MIDLSKLAPDLAARVLLMCEGPPVGASVTGPAQVYAALTPLLAGREAEAFAVLAFSRRNVLVDAAVLTTGSDAATVVDVAQVLRWALTRKRSAAAIVVAHNHPSGDPTPSAEDVTVTARIKAGCPVIGGYPVGDPDCGDVWLSRASWYRRRVRSASGLVRAYYVRRFRACLSEASSCRTVPGLGPNGGAL